MSDRDVSEVPHMAHELADLVTDHMRGFEHAADDDLTALWHDLYIELMVHRPGVLAKAQAEDKAFLAQYPIGGYTRSTGPK